jgi:hypothetical protein
LSFSKNLDKCLRIKKKCYLRGLLSKIVVQTVIQEWKWIEFFWLYLFKRFLKCLGIWKSFFGTKGHCTVATLHISWWKYNAKFCVKELNFYAILKFHVLGPILPYWLLKLAPGFSLIIAKVYHCRFSVIRVLQTN